MLWTSVVAAENLPTPVLHKKSKAIHERELVADVRLSLGSKLSAKKFSSCVPRSGKNFPEKLNKNLEKQIFTEKEMADLKKCKVNECAFRFRQDERAIIHQAKSEDEIKKAFFSFYQERLRDRVTPYSHEAEHRMTSSQEAFDFCSSKEFDRLLKDRKHPQAKNLLQVERYDDRMRPTTRLNRGLFFTGPESRSCFAEVLVFSNHYDLDRVEVWSIDQKELRLFVRQRIDFLNSWWRRLRKGDLEEVLQKWAQEEMLEMLSCLSEKPLKR